MTRKTLVVIAISTLTKIVLPGQWQAAPAWLDRLARPSVYLAWVSVASIANAAVALYSTGWRGGFIGEVGWTFIMLAVGAVLGVLGLIRNRNVACSLVFVWTYVGIAVKQAEWQAVVLSASTLATVLATMTLLVLIRQIRRAGGQHWTERTSMGWSEGFKTPHWRF